MSARISTSAPCRGDLSHSYPCQDTSCFNSPTLRASWWWLPEYAVFPATAVPSVPPAHRHFPANTQVMALCIPTHTPPYLRLRPQVGLHGPQVGIPCDGRSVAGRPVGRPVRSVRQYGRSVDQSGRVSSLLYSIWALGASHIMVKLFTMINVLYSRGRSIGWSVAVGRSRQLRARSRSVIATWGFTWGCTSPGYSPR